MYFVNLDDRHFSETHSSANGFVLVVYYVGVWFLTRSLHRRLKSIHTPRVRDGLWGCGDSPVAE